jgi:hypothetical protein
MEHTVTTKDDPLITRPRTAGAAAVVMERTWITCSCGHVEYLLWTPALLRRLERNGVSRELYLTYIIAQHAPEGAIHWP